MTAQPSFSHRLWSAIMLLGIVALVIWLPRAFALDRFVATDEVVWLWRSANFYYSLGQRDFGATYLSKHPGVVTLWIETAAFLLDFPEYRGFGQGKLNKYALFEALLRSKGKDPHDILVTSRGLTVLLNTLLLSASFLYARSLFGTLPSLMGFLLIAFDPFHNGITRMAHLDGPMGSFAFLSLMAFINFVHNGRRSRDLFVSAIAGGFSILAKIPGFILFPVVGLIALLDFWGKRRAIFASSGNRIRLWFETLIRPLAIWALAVLLTIFVFFPAMWVRPRDTLVKLTLSPLQVAENVLGDDDEVEREQIEIPARIVEKPVDYLIRYPYKYVWRSTPIVLAGLLLTLAAYIFRIGTLAELRTRRAILNLLLFVVVYTAVMTIPPKSSEKYYLPVYTVLDLVAGIGLYAGVAWVKKFFPPRMQTAIPAVILAALILTQALLALRTFPYYVTYFNPLLGGNRRANQVLMIGSGEGLDLAADYLNRKPNAEQLKVMSWYGIGPFSYYFVGESVPLYGSREWSVQDIARLRQVDYLVVYSNQWRRQLPGGLFPWLEGVEPEQRIWFDGIELARIYNVKSFPPEKFSVHP
jgi:hypothetical protein